MELECLEHIRNLWNGQNESNMDINIYVWLDYSQVSSQSLGLNISQLCKGSINCCCGRNSMTDNLVFVYITTLSIVQLFYTSTIMDINNNN